MQNIDDFIRHIYKEHNAKIYVDKEQINWMNRLTEMIAREAVIIAQEKQRAIPIPDIYFVDNDKLGALESQYNGKYYILLNNGNFIAHKEFVMRRIEKQGGKFNINLIDKLVDYTIMFVAMHEYLHIYCGHCLTEETEKLAQEAEADKEATNYLIKKIINDFSGEEILEELVACFVAIFYYFKHMDEQIEYNDNYNIKLAENYYETKHRTHPLNSQRIMYIFNCFNIILVDENGNSIVAIKDAIIEALFSLGEKKTDNIHAEALYGLCDDSIKKIEGWVEEIRIKIPRG